MKYWFYSEGNILGPYEPAEMLALPAFADESLVCPESATGDSPGDWRPATQVAEIAAALSVGVGRTVSAGAMTNSYEYETGFSSSVNYFDNREPAAGASYGELLDTIDNILGAYKEGPAAPGKPAETDYDLAEKFDIRLSRIQEELEAARWEKNLLLEKMRMKEMEEKKNKARIEELEARLKGEKEKLAGSVKETAQALHLAELKDKAETLRQIEEIKREELSLKEDEARRPAPEPAPAMEAAAEPVVEPAAEPEAPAAEPRGFKAQPISAAAFPETAPAADQPAPRIETRSFRSIKAGAEIKLARTVGDELKDEAENAGLTKRSFKSLGQTQPPAYVYGSHYDKPLPGPEAAPAGAFNPEAAAEPLPQQAGGIVYDFTVVTTRPADVQQFKIEARQEQPIDYRPVKPPTYDMGIQQASPAQQAQQAQPAPQFQPAASPAPAPAQPFQFQPAYQAPAQSPTPTFQQAAQAQPAYQFQPGAAAQPAPAAAPVAQIAPAAVEPQAAPAAAPADGPDSPDKTVRLTLPAQKGKPSVKADEKPRKKGGRTAFLAILVIFGSIAAGGLGYFFLGEGVSFSEFSMLSLGGKKKPSTLPSQLDSKAGGETAAAQGAAPAAQPQAEVQPAPVQTPAQQPVNENIKKAIDIVKNYKLSGGRGGIATWFANSFLSNTGGANEEWTATPLHGDILVVQYRLLRPKQEPLVYQFEVDSAKRDIVRGINNNALELLDFAAKEKSVSAAPVKKAAPKRAARKAVKRSEPDILPLPDAPAAEAGDQDPTGFENPGADSEQVKYLKAQESDEELF